MLKVWRKSWEPLNNIKYFLPPFSWSIKAKIVSSNCIFGVMLVSAQRCVLPQFRLKTMKLRYLLTYHEGGLNLSLLSNCTKLNSDKILSSDIFFWIFPILVSQSLHQTNCNYFNKALERLLGSRLDIMASLEPGSKP